MITSYTDSKPEFVPISEFVIENDKIQSNTKSVRLLGYNARSGYRDTDYKAKIALKKNATTSYSRAFYHIKPLVANSHWKVGSSINRRAIRMDSLESLPKNYSIPSDTVTRDTALKIFKSKFNENYSDFQALIPLAELKETRGLIRTTAEITTRLISELIAIKRGRGNARRIAELASDAWLQYSFAISPTLGDVDQLLLTITDHLTREDKTFRISKGFTKKWTASNKGTNAGFVADQSLDYVQEIHYELGYRFTAGYNLKLSSGNDYNARTRFGLDFQQLPLVAWELIPFSWVADYFGTMGAFLEDVFVSQPGQTVYLCESRKYKRTAITTGKLRPNATNVKIWHQDISPEVFTHYQFTRTPLTELPHRALRFKTADEIATNSVRKLLNLSSVFVGMNRTREYTQEVFNQPRISLGRRR